jgi:hypothetical protein
MSFLDKINAAPAGSTATAAAAAAKKVNPLLKKKLGAAKPEAASTEEAPKKKVVLPLKKKEAPKQEETKQEEVVETTSAPAEAPAEETPTETKVEVTEEKEAEVEAPAETTETAKEAEAPAEEAAEETEEETTEEEVVEEKPAPKKAETKKKSNSRSKKKTAAKQQDDEEEEEDTPTDIPTTTISFSEAIQTITSPFMDEEWEEFRKEVQDELSAIVISDDMNPGTLKVVISELSILREKVWFSYQEQKTLYERLSSKEPEGLIERVKRVNLGKGNNDMERKKAGIMACMQYSTEAGDINLFEVLDETRTRYNFLKSVIDSIKYKTDVLITLNGALKLENQHL